MSIKMGENHSIEGEDSFVFVQCLTPGGITVNGLKRFWQQSGGGGVIGKWDRLGNTTEYLKRCDYSDTNEAIAEEGQ